MIMQQQQQQNFAPQHKTPVNPRFSYNNQNMPSLGQQPPQPNNVNDQSGVHPQQQQQLQPTQQRQVTAYPANKMNMNGVRSP
jgi:hypothetical protein